MLTMNHSPPGYIGYILSPIFPDNDQLLLTNKCKKNLIEDTGVLFVDHCHLFNDTLYIWPFRLHSGKSTRYTMSV